jgi:hypothetical protein
MKRNTLLLGLLAFLLAFGLVLSGCGDISGLFGSNDDDDSNNNNNNNNDYTPYGLEEKFNGTPASMGVTSPMSADALVAFTGEVSGWADFVASGGQLYVNGNRVTSPSTTIYPNDTVRVLAPGGTNNNDNNSNYPIDPITGRPIFFQGTLLGLGVSYPISAESLVILKSEGEVHNWAEFIQVCELYVNGTLVVSGSQMINLTDTIKVLAQGGQQ